MQKTKHLKKRMSQRGLTGREINYTLEHGKIVQDKAVLGNKEIDKRIDEIDSRRRELENERSICMSIRDRGGCVVVTEDNVLITTYRIRTPKNKSSMRKSLR